MESLKDFFEYVASVLTDVYFHRHLAATFFGVLAGFLLSLGLQRRHERKSNRHARDMYLLALKVEVTHNTELLRELAAINSDTSKGHAYYELSNLQMLYSLLEGLSDRLRFNVFNGLMANGMLGFLEDRLVESILDTYRRLDYLILELKSSQAWLLQAPGETRALWLERRKGILDHLRELTGEVQKQAELTHQQIISFLPERLSGGVGPTLSRQSPHTEIGVD
jgi:hypothetical protein